jgi:hypothetical protein
MKDWKKVLLAGAVIASAQCAKAQSWQAQAPGNLVAQDAANSTSNVKVGIGTAAPSAALHTVGNLRFQGLPQNNGLTKILVQDANGNLALRDAFTLSGGAGPKTGWDLLGNSGTVPGVDFLGTKDARDLVFKINNIERFRLKNGIYNMSVGTNSSLSTGLIVNSEDVTKKSFPLTIIGNREGMSWEQPTNDSTADAYNTLGRIMRMAVNNEFLEGFYDFGIDQDNAFYISQHAPSPTTIPRKPFIIKNYPLTSTTMFPGSVYGSASLGQGGGYDAVGVNLQPGPDFTGSGTVIYPTLNNLMPTANFHVNGTVRMQNLPWGSGRILVQDIDGNVFAAPKVVRLDGTVDDPVDEDDWGEGVEIGGGGRGGRAFNEPRKKGAATQLNIYAELRKLKEEVAALKTALAAKNGGELMITSGVSINCSPNPTSNELKVSYQLPANTSSAYVAIFDLTGKEISRQQVGSSLGKSQISFMLGNLSNGMYLCSLMVNGKEASTQKIVVSK